MSYWDTSAIVPLLIDEASSHALRALAAADLEPATCWLTEIESWSALARLAREMRLAPPQDGQARVVLSRILADFHEIELNLEVRIQAGRLLRIHPLRASDAIQLAAALVWTQGNPDGQPFVCLDERLCLAATREGFRVLPEALLGTL